MFRYEVAFLNDVTNSEDYDRGFVSGKTYGEAADKLVEYFGKDAIYNLKLFEYDEVISDTEMKEIIN